MENYTERINLPLSQAMYEEIKARSKRDGLSAVAFIRQCIERELSRPPKIELLENRIEALEKALHAAEHDAPPYTTRGRPHHKAKGTESR